MSDETTETQVEQSKRETRREPSSPTGSQKARAPFLNEGIEQIRDSHC
jgi:hypothetical protein